MSSWISCGDSLADTQQIFWHLVFSKGIVVPLFALTPLSLWLVSLSQVCCKYIDFNIAIICLVWKIIAGDNKSSPTCSPHPAGQTVRLTSRWSAECSHCCQRSRCFASWCPLTHNLPGIYFNYIIMLLRWNLCKFVFVALMKRCTVFNGQFIHKWKFSHYLLTLMPTEGQV